MLFVFQIITVPFLFLNFEIILINFDKNKDSFKIKLLDNQQKPIDSDHN